LKVQKQSLDSAKVSKSTLPTIFYQPESPVHNYSYFCNKTLDQYYNLYRKYSSEDIDYYKWHY